MNKGGQKVDKKLRAKLKLEQSIVEKEQKVDYDWLHLKTEGGLEPENELEQTWRIKQEDILEHTEVGAAEKRFDLKLPELGPYTHNYSRDGRWLLLGGRKGHIAMLDWSKSKPVCEVQVKEAIKDVCFLHNNVFFAVAQRKYVYVYDKRGLEVHCMREHFGINRLQFLPYHFLLASVGDSGVLRYQDTSTGEIIAQSKTKLGPCKALCQNPQNAILCLGHSGGTVTMWSPNISTPLVKMLCHRGPVYDLAVDMSGRYIATIGSDKQLKVWDVRTYKPVHAYYCSAPAHRIDISQRGLIALSWGSRVQIWKDALSTKASAPYLNHHHNLGKVSDLMFCPYEDVLGIGHQNGFSSILVPGAGEPNYDSFVANPFQSRKERREAEVHSLLEKLQPDTIVIDPTVVGNLKKEPKEVVAERLASERAAAAARLEKQRKRNELKARMKGKNKPSKRHRKKQLNIIRDRSDEVKKMVQEKASRDENKTSSVKSGVPSSLHKFF